MTDEHLPRDRRVPIPMRIAFREEGKWLNAYFARAGTMDGAIKLVSIRKSLVDAAGGSKSLLFEAFMALAQQAMAIKLRELLGEGKVVWSEPERAPEHERAGNG